MNATPATKREKFQTPAMDARTICGVRRAPAPYAMGRDPWMQNPSTMKPIGKHAETLPALPSSRLGKQTVRYALGVLMGNVGNANARNARRNPRHKHVETLTALPQSRLTTL